MAKEKLKETETRLQKELTVKSIFYFYVFSFIFDSSKFLFVFKAA